MYSYGPLHMAGQKQDNQHEHTFSNYVRIRNVALKTCQRRWTIGKSGERVARHDDYRTEVEHNINVAGFFCFLLFFHWLACRKNFPNQIPPVSLCILNSKRKVKNEDKHNNWIRSISFCKTAQTFPWASFVLHKIFLE